MPRLKVFLSYRRDDFHQLAPGLVRGVHGRLEQHYGMGHVFMDIDAIPPGANFVTYIGSWVEKADVLLAVIGPQWAELMEERRDDPRDFVRIEIEAALRRGIPVVPVLMGGAKMPTARSLPTALADLVDLNAVTVDHAKDFTVHMDRLIRDLDRHYGADTPSTAAAPAPVSATQERPWVNSLGIPFVPVPGAKVWFAQWPVRVQDFAQFAAETFHIDGSWKNVEYKGHKQGPDHPVVKVTWGDAQAFCEWISKKEGKIYRLPTDHEWSLAVGIGDREDAKATPEDKSGKIQGVYPWGTQWPPPKGAGNYAGEEAKVFGADFTVIDGYRDNHPFTSPVGSYTANPFGIYDLGGNVWEWCEDPYESASSSRVLRGASWGFSNPVDLLSSIRSLSDPSFRYYDIGFRVVVVGVGER